VVALLGHALWRMGRRAWQSPWHIGVGLATFAATYWAGFPFPAVLVIAMLLGFVLPESKPALAAPNGQGAQGVSGVEVESRAPRLADTLRTTGIFAGLFAFSFFGLMLAAGWDHVLTQLAWFFTQCAWLTFGGAYAVLPFVMENAVNQYGWLSMSQMMHGLALGESTPGPLIMVVTYVGYVAGMQAPLADAFAWGAFGVVNGPVVIAWIGAAAATWFTFLPSFFFIFAGAPWIEASHGMPFLTRPLRFVSAAVIGPMAALALVFAHHVFWPESRAGGFDAVAAGLSVALAALLGHRRMTVPWVILLGALAGFAISALRA
jgi:chromate transporter